MAEGAPVTARAHNPPNDSGQASRLIDTFMKSLDCLAPLGLLAFFGQSSGPVEPFNLALLAQKGSLFITRPTLQTYGAKR